MGEGQGEGIAFSTRAPTCWRWAVVALVLWASVADAQTARLSILADSVTTGEPFEVAVAVDHEPGRQTTFPEPPLGGAESRPFLSFGDAEVRSAQRFPPAARGDSRTDSVVYRVVTFAADTARVGPVSIQVSGRDEAFVVETGSALVPVRSVLASEAPPYEPAPFGPPDSFPSATPIWIALGALAALVTALGVWGAVRLLRPTRTVPAPEPYPTAIARLDALDRETPSTPAEIEAHVVALRAVVRDYLSDRLRLPAREATTLELAPLLRADDRVDDGAADAVRRALRPTDLVAFARVRPAAEVVARIRAEARAAVDAVERGIREEESGVGDQESGTRGQESGIRDQGSERVEGTEAKQTPSAPSPLPHSPPPTA